MFGRELAIEKMEKTVDLLLQGGQLLDPASGTEGRYDLAISEGKVVEIGADLSGLSAKTRVTLSGEYVVPGLVDMHCHLYPHFPVAQDGLSCIQADAHLLGQGVTTCVDAGTCGIRDYVRFRECFVLPARVRTLTMLNIATGGMVNIDTEQDPTQFLPGAVAGMAAAFPEIVAIKTAHYWVGKPFDTKHPAWASVDATLRAAALAGLPAMIDFQPTLPERSYEELILKKLRPGDIHTHMYAQQFPVLDAEGKVNPALWQARERGVLFDLGHGAQSFWFRNAVPALRQGFPPDTLSSDLYFDNVNGPVFGFLDILSKYWSMGMSLSDVIFKATKRPAEVLGHPELGDLAVGSGADVAVLAAHTGEFAFPDGGRTRMKGQKRLSCLMTIRGGEIVYDRDAKSLPDWESAPESYWVAPGVVW